MELINFTLRFVDIKIVSTASDSEPEKQDLLYISNILNSREQMNDLYAWFRISKCGGIFSTL